MPDMPGNYSEDGFHRQRRNLVVGSVVLFFVHVADVRIGTQVSILGVPAAIGRPGAIHWFLFAAVAYWGWRFYTFHRQRRPAEMQTAAREFMYRFLRRRALNCIIPSRPTFEAPHVPDGTPYELVPHDFGIATYQYDRIDAHVNPAWLVTRPDGNKEILNIGDQKVLFEGRIMWTARILGYLKASVNTPALSEYLLPYFFFAVSIGYALYRTMA